MAKKLPDLTTVHANIIYRVPQFSMNASLEQSWEALVQSIERSSPAFYEEIKSLNAADIEKLPKKKMVTIQKYFNRARYRATPYGSFAGVGCFSNYDGTETNNPVIIEDEQELCCFKDWPLKNEYNYSLSEVYENDPILIANSSCYHFNGNIRYIYKNEKGFELSDIVPHPMITEALKACQQPIHLQSLKVKLSNIYVDDAEFYNLIEGLLSLQLVAISLQPNIIGEDYFRRINFTPGDNKDYIIARRNYVKGGVDNNVLKHLPELCTFFQQLPERKKEAGLERFILRFLKRYDRRAVPLMEALDPEMGIGYDDMEQDFNAQGIASDFVPSGTVDGDSPLKLFFTGKLPLAGKSVAESTILLHEFKTDDKHVAKPLPNSISALVEVAGNFLQIVSFSGSNANALAGRFTIADKTIHRHCRAVAEQEQNANPDVLFFDIAYTSEDQVDNVNRRKSIYNYQLTIGNFDTSEDPLQLSDLLLFVHNNLLILWSKKHQKRLIPRMTTAYNYTRSDLPVFRLLCDLQHQGLTTQYSLQLRSIMPNFSFYPRVQFHNIILSPAAWKLDWQEYVSLGISLPLYLNQLKVVQWVRAGMGDQTLIFNCDSAPDLTLLLSILEKEKTLYVEETILPLSAIVQDKAGSAYAAQLLLTLQHNEPVYKNIAPVLRKPNAKDSYAYTPGSKWLYTELYAHPRQFDRILTGGICEWLTQNQNLIEQWFFIRFNEGGHHLRVRVKLKAANLFFQLLNHLNELLKNDIETGIISDIQIKTYQPEWERYDPDMMEMVEQHFNADSWYVMEVASFGYSDAIKYRLCINLLHLLSGMFEDKAFDIWLTNTNTNWEQEHQLSPIGFKKLNQHFKTFISTVASDITDIILNRQTHFEQSFLNVLQKAHANARLDLLNNLMHMHINRMFNYHQRTHEMIVYYFYTKDLQLIANKQQAVLSDAKKSFNLSSS